MSQSAREHFGNLGRLEKPRGPKWEFALGRLIGSVRIGQDCWESVVEPDRLRTDWLAIGKTETVEGYTMYRLVIWRLYVLIAWADS